MLYNRWRAPSPESARPPNPALRLGMSASLTIGPEHARRRGGRRRPYDVAPPFLKPSNFPMELLLYTDILFIVAGIAQIFWPLPMIKGWGLRWYYLFQLTTMSLLDDGWEVIKQLLLTPTMRVDIPLCVWNIHNSTVSLIIIYCCRSRTCHYRIINSNC